MAQVNTSIAAPESSTIDGFDGLRILDNEFTVTIGGGEYTFETPKDSFGRIISINGNGKNREITYGTETASSFAGVEYEQIYLDLPDLIPPTINNVEITTLDPVNGIYRLSVSSADCTLDSRAVPFFFFNSWEGVFENYTVGANDLTSVVFKVSPNIGGRKAWVVVGVGDGLGQIHRKTILLEGVY